MIFDEFPYLIQANPAIPGIFQKGWDEYLADSNIFLILLGSSMAMMENEVLGYRSPLYGRRTGQWLVEPMTFRAASQFRAEQPFQDKLAHFAVAGGIPAYWLHFAKNKDFPANLTDHVLRKGEMLYDEVEFLLRAEVREPRYYFALLQAIANKYLGETYEKVARETLLADMDAFFPFTAIGRWWDRGEEIDVVAINQEQDSILFCEAKTTEKKVGIDVLLSLREKSKKVAWGSADRKEFFCLFSRVGFTDNLIAEAGKEQVVLYTEDRRHTG